MTEIVLEGLEFYAYHGYLQQEQVIGNRYSLDIKVQLESLFKLEELDSTIDYEVLYKIAKEKMSEKYKLLESIAESIISDIFIHVSNISYAEVSVSKYNPPIGGLCNKAKITIRKYK